MPPGNHGRNTPAIGKNTIEGPRQTFWFSAGLSVYYSRGTEYSVPLFPGSGGTLSPQIGLAYCFARWRISARIWRKAMAKVVVVTVTAVRSATGSARMTASTLFTGSTAGRI